MRVTMARKPGAGDAPARLPATALDQTMYHASRIQDGQCRVAAGFAARLDESRLARAVELTFSAAPVLGCRYVPGTWKARWERCPPDSAVPFRLEETHSPDLAIDAFLAAASDPLRGPQVAVCLVRSVGDTLCVKLDHLAADATGLMVYVRLLRDIYCNLQINPDYRPVMPAADGRGLGQVIRAAGSREVWRGLRNYRLVKAEWSFPCRSSDLSGCAFPRRRIDAKRLDLLRGWCRSRQVRFNEVLLTAYHRALSRHLDPPAGALLPLEVTTDLRRHLPVGALRTVADLSGARFPAIRHVPGAGFDETLASIRAALAKTHLAWLGSALMLQALTNLPTFVQSALARAVVGRYFAGGASPILSNLGIIDAATFDFPDAPAVDVGLFGPVMFPPHFVVTAYTFRGELSITSSVCDTAVDVRLVDAVLDGILQELPA